MTDAVPARGTRRGAAVAWVIVIALAITLAVIASMEKAESTQGNPVQLHMVAKQLVGSGGGSASALDAVAEGSFGHRLRVAVVVTELEGPGAGLAGLPDVDAAAPPTADDLRAHTLLTALWTPSEGATLAKRADAAAPADREFLVEHLGWFGALATVPGGTSRTAEREALLASSRGTAGRMMAVVVLGLVALGTGMLLLIAFPVLCGSGRTALRLAPEPGSGGLLIETFAVWLVLVVVSSTLLSWAFDGSAGLVVGMAPQVIAISALAWPTLRGASWADTRRRLGLHSGRGILREVLCGGVAYLMVLPIVGVGFIVTLGLTLWAKSAGLSSDATHPIVAILLEADAATVVGVFVAGSVIAPVLEETFFRGALYRHLRETTGAWSRWLSVPFSGLLTGFVFAAIHPQGWLAIPALAAMGFGFALAREWRDSLIAPIVAHGISNGLVFTALLVMFRL